MGNPPPSIGPESNENVIDVPVEVVSDDKLGEFGRYAIEVACVIIRGEEEPPGLFCNER